MLDILPPLPSFTTFLIASFVLAVTPGPGVLYIVTRSLAQGRMSGFASVFGVALGNLGNALGASLGLAALFAMSSGVFVAVKYLGAAYLIYMGIKTIRKHEQPVLPGQNDVQPENLRKIFIDGLMVALLNPKTALFFAAFLPQFVHAENGALFQTIMLGVVFVLLAMTTDTVYVLLAAHVRIMIRRKGKTIHNLGKYLSGAVFIGLGVLTALSNSAV